MRSLDPQRRVSAPRRLSLLVLPLAVLTCLGAVAPLVPASGASGASGAGRVAAHGVRADVDVAPVAASSARVQALPPGHRTARARAATNPDLPTLPPSCRPDYGYMAPEPCRLVPLKPGAPLVVLWGDSHGWMMTPAIRKAVARKRVNVVSLLQGSCPVMDSDLSTPAAYADRNGCDEFGKLALDYIERASRRARPMRVVVAMSWELYHNATDAPNAADERYPGYVNDYIATNARKSLRGTPRAFRALARLRIPTDVVGQEPMVYQGAPECPSGPYRCPLPRWGVLKDAAENNARIRQLRSLLSRKGLLIRPATSLCDSTTCYGEYQGVPTYWDGLHVGQRASYRLAPHFAPTVAAVLRQAAAQRARLQSRHR